MKTNTGLLVPIDLTAYCLGKTDAVKAEKFSGATTWYSQMNGDNGATLGSNVVRAFDDAPLWPMEAGVHLHWAMPDALMHGTQGDTGIDFSALPNRWLIKRIYMQDKKICSAAWIVLSDMLSSGQPDNNEAPSVPVQDTENNFRYLGVYNVYTEEWKEPDIPSHESMTALFGSPLHAVVSGDIAFASFYPNARNIFGFHDQMEINDLNGDLEVMYSIVGWYSDASHDPMNTARTLEELQTVYNWSCEDYPDTPPSYSLFHGQVEDVIWNPDKEYTKENSQPLKADVALGNNPSEALAAYFHGRNRETVSHFETLFTAFEIGSLHELQHPQPGQWANLLETLHTKQFNSHSGGTIYAVSARPDNTSLRLAKKTVTPIPPLLADDLNLLNQYEQELFLANTEVRQYFWQLFAAWYRIIQVSDNDATYAYNALEIQIKRKDDIISKQTTAADNRDKQLQTVKAMLGDFWELTEQPGPDFLSPNEPALVLAGEHCNTVTRYGGDGLHHESGYLMCRLDTAAISKIQVNTGTPRVLDNKTFASVDLPPKTTLTYAQEINSLLEESCLLNTGFVAQLLGGDEQQLKSDLEDWLKGTQTKDNRYQSFSGKLPSPAAIQWNNGNPWFPLFLTWQVKFHPLFNTDDQGTLKDYSDDFFTANFNVDINNIGTISYSPSGTAKGSIDIDPAAIDFDAAGIQQMQGKAVLSSTAAENLELNLNKYLQTHEDPVLSAVLADLQNTNILTQSLSGFNAALLMGEESLQLHISTSSANFEVKMLTRQVTEIIQDISKLPPTVPLLNGFFNPIRAGFTKISVQIVDIFGHKRPVSIENLYLAETMGTVYKGAPEKEIMYLQPRLSQPARLLFRWLAADSTEEDEMNSHPATTPVCGWLLTNHLDRGFFIYNRQGRPLGSLVPGLDGKKIIWQAAPGDEDTIDKNVDQVMADQNKHLADVVNMLAAATPDFFADFWKSVDKAAGMTTPTRPDSSVGQGVLVGRPLALVQASLLLSLRGFAATNWSWDTLVNQEFIDTDNGLSNVQFPLVLGHIDQIDDGLIGYFKQNDQETFEYRTFYTYTPPDNASQGIKVPDATNLLVTPHATKPDGSPSVRDGEQKVLMLMDPRAGIHLSSGILPTQYLQIPPEQYTDTLKSLELSFLTTPVLQPSGQITIPLNIDKNYCWSWIEENSIDRKHVWNTIPDIGTAAANAVWSYSPQTIREGWLRLNPVLLQFTLATTDGKRIVSAGSTVDLQLQLSNLLHETVEFDPSDIVHEGESPKGSILFIHFSDLVNPDDVPDIQFSADQWSFQSLRDTQYGNYWAASPMSGQKVTIPAQSSLTLSLNNVKINKKANGQCKVYFDYYKVTGIAGDGVDIAALSIQDKTQK